MKMRIYLLAFFLMFSGMVTTQAATRNHSAQQQRVAEIKSRVAEIQEMNIAQLSSAEKKDLKQELKNTRSELKDMSPGIYISVGALLLIILLIILLL